MHDRNGANDLGGTALQSLGQRLLAAGYDFTTVSPATHARVNARPGLDTARDLRDVFGWSRPFEPELLSDDWTGLMRAAGVLAADGPRWRSTVRASTLAGHLFFHSAYPTSAEEAVFFGPDTYRFAGAISGWLTPERSAGIRSAVDIGAGAGPGGVLVARSAPEADVALLDINVEALRLAQVNAALADTPRVRAVRSDLLGGVDGEFDLIVSNPPYLNDPLRRTYRHGGGELGAGLSEAILSASLDRLASGGTLILYTGVAIVKGRDPFRALAEERLECRDVTWSYREIDPDVFGEELETDTYSEADRIAAVVLIARRGD